MYDRYLRIRSTATRIEYLRHPRARNPKTIAETEAIAEGIRQVKSPMLVIAGSLDPLIPSAKRLHELVSHSNFHEVEGAPHNVYWEAAEEWNNEVRHFLHSLSIG